MQKKLQDSEIKYLDILPLTWQERLANKVTYLIEKIRSWITVEDSIEESLQRLTSGLLPYHRLKKPAKLGAPFRSWRRIVRTGEILLGKNNAKEALPLLLGAQKAKEDDVVLLASIGIAWKNIGDLKSAHSFFNRALEFKPDSNILQQLCNTSKNSPLPRQSAQLSAKGKPKIHIAILTFNALASTKMCIESIVRTVSVPHEIYVFDNMSQKDETRDWLIQQTDFPIKVRLNEVNLGVPGGRNSLADWCLSEASDDDFILFVDNDIEFFPGWDQMALELFDKYPGTGLLSADGHKIRLRDPRRKLIRKTGKMQKIDTGCGYYFWVRAKVLRQVSGFDENLGLFWHEDDDFTIHVLANGYDAISVPETPILHRAHQSGAATAGPVKTGSPLNQAYLCKKWRAMNMVDGNHRIKRNGQFQVVKQQGRNAIAGELFQQNLAKAKA